MAKSKIVPVTIMIDTREQLPYFFKDYPCNVTRRALKSGDYSIHGYENEVTIERKSKEDLFQSLGKERDRFHREFQRLSEYRYSALVIESSLNGLLEQPGYSRMNPSSVINSVISWGLKYGVQIYFADNRKLAECLIYKIFYHYVSNQVRETKELLKV